MKKTITIIALFLVSLITAQELNQFDSNNKRHGKWKKMYEGTKKVRYQGQFKNGKEVGIFKFYHQSPKGKHPSCIKQFLENEIADVKYYSTHGFLLEKGQMNGKNRIGKWVTYDRKTKEIIIEENYIKGKLEGNLKSFYTGGKILKIEEYKNGKKNGRTTMYAPNGKIVSRYGFVNGRKNGVFIKNDKEGAIELEGKFTNGKPRGIWKYYTNGKIIKTKDYTKSNNPMKQ